MHPIFMPTPHLAISGRVILLLAKITAEGKRYQQFSANVKSRHKR
jgi:hypothetical protein